MVREGEEHAAEDKRRREAAETRNTAEQLAYSIEKLIKENDEKLPEDVKSEVQGDVDALKSALAGDDDDAVKTAFDKLNESQGKLGEAIYASSQADAAAGASDEHRAGRRAPAPTKTLSTPRLSTTRTKRRSNDTTSTKRPKTSRSDESSRATPRRAPVRDRRATTPRPNGRGGRRDEAVERRQMRRSTPRASKRTS